MKALVLTYTSTLSHLSRGLEVGKALRQRGVEVVFAGEGTYLSLAEEVGFGTETLFEMDPDKLFAAIRARKLRFVGFHLLKNLVAADLELYDRVKPDVVISDGRISVGISSRARGIPHIGLANSSATRYRLFPYVPVLPARFTIVNTLIESVVFNLFNDSFVTNSILNGVFPPVWAMEFFEGTAMTLLCDIESLGPVRKKPDHFHYIGPLTWRLTDAKAPWRETVAWKNRRKTIYATMGTTGVESFFPTLFALAQRTPEWFWIVSTGGQYPIPLIQPENMWMEELVNGDEAVADADVVVCHGGNGTLYQCLQKGTPVLGMAVIHEQDYHLRRLEKLGVGKRYSLNRFLKNPDELISEVQKMLEDQEIKKRAEVLKSELFQRSPSEIAADLIVNWMNGREQK